MQQKKRKKKATLFKKKIKKIMLENYYRHIRKINFPPINEMLS